MNGRKYRKSIKLFIILFFSSFILNSCGYKPINQYAKKQIDGKVFVKLFIDLEEPRNAVLIKDAINKILLQKLDSKLVYNEDDADMLLNLKIGSIVMQELQYDSSGYNKVYRALVDINIDYKRKSDQNKTNFIVEGEHNFSIDDGTTITDTKRFEAIRDASADALDEVLSKLAIISFKK